MASRAPYHFEIKKGNLHGCFSRDIKPALSVEPGETVCFSTIDAAWGLEPNAPNKTSRKKFDPRDPKLDRGHALCGPIEIVGAMPGKTLAVHINKIRTGTWGWTFAGGNSPTNQRLGTSDGEVLLAWTLDPDRLVGRSHTGYEVPLSPFMGIMGMPPDEEGIHSTWPPRPCGGNLDCKELVAGSTLYLPITVPGGLFSIGDGHAAQGDGEVCTQAIECPMEQVEVTFDLPNDIEITSPLAVTPAGVVTFGFHENLDECTLLALNSMLDYLHRKYGFERKEALAYASVVVNMRITQICNGIRGVHAILPHKALELL